MTCDNKALKRFWKKDEVELLRYENLMTKLSQDAKFSDYRYYHVFHQLPKQFREDVLRFDGEQIKEIFDITAADMWMMTKYIEETYSDLIPSEEMKSFEHAIKMDIRKIFGTKKDGKCKKLVKQAFKIFLNGKKKAENFNDDFDPEYREGSILSKIDQFFKCMFPNVRRAIMTTKDFWKIYFKMEYEIVSDKMFNYLKDRGIYSLTCHDAIYVKKSDLESIQKLNINMQKLFEEFLNLKYIKCEA